MREYVEPMHGDITSGWGQGQVFPRYCLLIQEFENKCTHKFAKEAKLVTLFRAKQCIVQIRERDAIKLLLEVLLLWSSRHRIGQ